MPKEFKSSFLAKIVEGEVNTKDIIVTNFASLKDANPSSICFFNDPKYKNELLETNAGIVLLQKADSSYYSGPAIFVKNPYLAFAKIATLFQDKIKKNTVHHTALIGKDTKISNNTHLGAYVVIGEKCNIGFNVEINENTVIGDNVIIGNNSKIHSNVTIHSETIIGEDCEIFSGAQLGSYGFGYAKDNDGKWIKIPQVGNVTIGNFVDIGSNTTIDRGAIDNTIIKDGVKIDNLVQIGHNCIIEENTIIAGCVGIAGSTLVGKNCMIGGAAMIKGHISIADNTIISGGTGIGKTINEPGKRFTNVFPYNLEHKHWLKIASTLKRIGHKNE